MGKLQKILLGPVFLYGCKLQLNFPISNLQGTKIFVRDRERKLHKSSYDYKEVRLSLYPRFTLRNYNEDGSINVTDPRSGKNMHQTYLCRGNQIKKAIKF